MQPRSRPSLRVSLALITGAALLALAACSGGDGSAPLTAACTDGDRALSAGFYASFAPVSASATADPDSPGFNVHVGYEADLLTALEAMEGAGLSFSRRAIDRWPGIWLLPAGPGYDIVGGGITILDARRRDASGAESVVFTSGHIAFRQSLLVRAEDAGRFPDHAALTSEDRVGALAGTTGEARLLQLTGLADAGGVLGRRSALKRRVRGGSPTAAPAMYTAAAASPSLLEAAPHPALGGNAAVDLPGCGWRRGELLEALAGGAIDAVARGEIGNRDAARASRGAFAVTALDSAVEWGGFALALADAELAACIDAKIDYLTDERRIGYAQWLEDPGVFLRRAGRWNRQR